MLYVEGSTIRLTRGDTAYIEIPIVAKLEDGTDQPYVLAPDDELTLTIKRNIKDAEPYVQKKLMGTNLFHICPEDTYACEFAKYIYDVQLKTAAGDVYTVIEPCTFEILKEVTC